MANRADSSIVLFSALSESDVEALRSHFTELDRNGDGFVDFSDVQYWFREVFFGADDSMVCDAAKQLIDLADKNRDSRIDIVEFVAAFDTAAHAGKGHDLAVQQLVSVPRVAMESWAAAEATIKFLTRSQLQSLAARLDKARTVGTVTGSQVRAAVEEAFFGADEGLIDSVVEYVKNCPRDAHGRIDLSKFIHEFQSRASKRLLTRSPVGQHGDSTHLTREQFDVLVRHYRPVDLAAISLPPSEVPRALFALFPTAPEELLSSVATLLCSVPPDSQGRVDLSGFIDVFAEGSNPLDPATPPVETHPTSYSHPSFIMRSRKSVPQPRHSFAKLDAHLTPAQLEELRTDFQPIDVAGDGFVHDSEIRPLLRTAFSDPSNALVEQLATILIDCAERRSADGKIDFAGFIGTFSDRDGHVRSESLARVRPHASHGRYEREDGTSQVHRASNSRQPLPDDLAAELAGFLRSETASRWKTASSFSELEEILLQVFEGAPPRMIADASAHLFQSLARTGRGQIAIGPFFEEMLEIASSQSLVVEQDTAVNVLSLDELPDSPAGETAVQSLDGAALAVNQCLNADERDVLRDVFIALDTDGDGFVTRDQLLDVCSLVLGERFHQVASVLAREFEQADFDHDGRLSLLEFSASFAKGPGVAPREVLEAGVADIKVRLTDDEIGKLIENFHASDSDFDGFLSPNELRAALQDVFASGLDDARYTEIVSIILKVADRDGDGRISISEFIRSFQEDLGVLPPSFACSRSELIAGLVGPELLHGVIDIVARVNDRSEHENLDKPAVYNLLQSEMTPLLQGRLPRDAPVTAIAEQVARWVVSAADRDGQRHVTLSSFLDGYRRYAALNDAPPLEQPPSYPLTNGEEIADQTNVKALKVFAVLDDNHDGYIERGDLTSLIERLLRQQHADWDESEIASAALTVFATADKDNDERLSEVEFLNSFRLGCGVLPDEYVDYISSRLLRKLNENDILAVLAACLQIDSQVDGFATKQELRDTLRPALERILPNENATHDAICDVAVQGSPPGADGKLRFSLFVSELQSDLDTLRLPLQAAEARIARTVLRPAGSRASSIFSADGDTGRRGLDVIFEGLDVNRSGFLEPHEIVPLIFNSIAGAHPTWSYELIDRSALVAFEQADADGDGKLSRTDWTSAFELGRPIISLDDTEKALSEIQTPNSSGSRITPKDIHNLTYVFSKFDRDGDGFVDFAGLRIGLDAVLRHRHPDWTSNRIDVAVQCMLNAADTDRDGRLSLGEFVKSFSTGTSVLPLDLVTEATLWQATGKRALTTVEIDQLRVAFNDIDINKDGNISQVELAQLLHESDFELDASSINEIVRGVIQRADSDNDGEVSFEEFVTAFEADPKVLHLPLLAARERIARAEATLANMLAEEEMRRIARVFVDLDDDKNGVLDYAELHEEMKAAMMQMHPDWDAVKIEECVRGVFDAADVNGDGMLSLEEFISTFTNKHYVLPPTWLDERVAKLTRRLTSEELDELKEVFHAIDVNNDGVLSTKELESLLRESLSGHMSADQANINAIVAAVLHVVDLNNDGCVSFAEFVSAYQRDVTVLDIPIMAAAARREVAERKLETMLCEKDMRDLAKVFLHLDRNGDGFLSQDTLRSAMQQELRRSHPEWSDEKLKISVVSLLQSADINHDGKLSFDEFIATFVAGHYVLPPRYIKDVAAVMSRKLSDDEVHEIEEVFRTIDSKGDGFVTPQMLRSLLHSAVDEQTSEAIVDAIMLVADENHDGRLSMQEFVKCYQLDNSLLRIPISTVSKRTLGKIAAKVLPKDKIRDYGRVFNFVDANHDGFVDFEELVAALRALTPLADPEGVEAVAKAKFLQADLDGDDLLSLDEFVASFTYDQAKFFTQQHVDDILSRVGRSPSITPSPTRLSSYASGDTAAPDALKAEAQPAVVADKPTVTPSEPRRADVLIVPTPPRFTRPGETIVRSPYRNVGNVAVFDEDLRELFDRYDVNKNGFLEVGEFRQAYASLEQFGLAVSEREIQRLFAPYAPNGRLSYDAFCVLMLKRSRM